MRSNAIFPELPGLAWNLQQEVMFKNTVQTSQALREVRIRYADLPLYKISLSYEFLRSGKQVSDASRRDYDRLRDFHFSMGGNFNSFLYRHFYDNRLVDSAIGTSDAVRTAFQAGRTTSTGAFEPTFNLTGPVVVKANGVVVDPVNYTIDANGLILFTSPPASGVAITVTADFLYRARFAEESQGFTAMNARFWSGQVRLIGSTSDKV